MQSKDFYRGRSIAVYGASGGLGEALCRELQNKAGRLILAGRSQQKLEALQRQLEQAGPANTKIEVWSIASSMADFAQRIREQQLDGLILATGKTFYQDFCGEREGQEPGRLWPGYRELLQVNLADVAELVLELLPYFRRRGGFFHIAGSYTCIFPVPYQALYSASKAALLSFVLAVTKEQEAEFGRAEVRGLLSLSLIGGMATNMYYQSDLHRQFSALGFWERLVVAPPQQIARSLLRGVARRRKIIAVGLAGPLSYHLLRRLPGPWLSAVLLWAYRPRH